MRAGLLSNVALALASFLATGGIIETWLRVTDAAARERSEAEAIDWAPPASADSPLSRLLLHPYLGWAEPRDSTIISEALSFPSEDYVVAIFGGSVAELLVRLAGKEFADQIAERHPELRGRLRVLGLGHGGYKQPQQLILLLELLLLGAPIDLAVEVDGYNEIALAHETGRKGVHPLFPSEAHYPAVRDAAGGLTDRGSIRLVARALELVERADRVRAWLDTGRGLARSHLVQWLAGRLASAWQSEATALQIVWNERAAAGSARSVATLSDDCLDASRNCFDLQASIWFQSSVSMAALARSYGLSYVQVLQPNQYIAGSKLLTEDERRLAYQPEHRRSRAMDPGYAKLRERGSELTARGIAFHDLSMLFAAERETLYTDICCHFNQRGNEIFARAIAERIDLGISPVSAQP